MLYSPLGITGVLESPKHNGGTIWYRQCEELYLASCNSRHQTGKRVPERV